MPLEQSTRWNMVFYYVRTAIDPEQAAPLIRREVAALDPNLPIRELKNDADANRGKYVLGAHIVRFHEHFCRIGDRARRG